MARRLSSIFSTPKGEADGNSSHSLAKKLSSSKLNQFIHHPLEPKHQYSLSNEGRKPSAATLAPPPMFGDPSSVRPPSSHGSGSRPQSVGGSPESINRRSRPQTPNHLTVEAGQSPKSPGSAKPIKTKNHLVKGAKSGNKNSPQSRAWIAGLKDHAPYDLEPLLQGNPVPDLWHDHGDTFIHLYPRSTGRGPSFKVHSSLFADSQALNVLRFEALTSAQETRAIYQPSQSHVASLAVQQLPSHQSGRYSPAGANLESPRYPASSSFNQESLGEVHVWLPLELERPLTGIGEEPQGQDFELIVLYRNFFAFLSGGALVATSRQHGLYSIFMGISTMLKKYDFGEDDGSTWGNIPTASFAHYCAELSIADVRFSREKTIEAIVLGEHMRYWPLYNEGFVHATGTLEDIKAIQSPKFAQVSHITLNRLELAHIDLQARLLTVQNKLGKFDFPSMFSGVANSQTSMESKSVSFKAWKEAFFGFHKFVLAHYKRRYGSWPPKANKKTHFEESGLNRLVLRDIYRDFTELYDMLVDRTCLTPRTEGIYLPPRTTASGGIESIQHALRAIESEYDRSTPPVAPPIPFDVPIIPAFANSFDRTHVMELSTRPRSASTVKLKQSAVSSIFLGSCNRDKIRASDFIQEFLTYERKLGEGKILDDLVDNRCGQWLFIYAVLQSLPMTVVDARDLQFTDGVESLLCIGPRGGRPWMKEDTSQSRAWYNVASGGGYVSLPADLIDHSVEGIYRRSHCWQVATEWVTEDTVASPHETSPQTPSELTPSSSNFLYSEPESISQSDAFEGTRRVNSSSVSPRVSPLLQPQSTYNREQRKSSLNFGLEATPLPPPKDARPVSILNPAITFDSILADSQAPKHSKKSSKG